MSENHRTTRFQRVQRLDEVQRWLGTGMSVIQIKLRAMKKYGIDQSTAHRYLWRARESLMRMAKSPVDFQRANAMRFYDDITSNDQLPVVVRLQAMKQKMEVLERPSSKFEVKHTGSIGIGESVSELISQMSKDSYVRDEVLRLDREIKLIERAERSDTNGSAAVHTGTNGTSSTGGNGTNGTHEALPDA